MFSLTREEARALDRRAMDEFAVPGIVLMENAGRGMAELLCSLGVRRAADPVPLAPVLGGEGLGVRGSSGAGSTPSPPTPLPLRTGGEGRKSPAAPITGAVVVCCGRGNNGGDGLVIARHLDIAGFSVRVVLFAEPGQLSGGAAVNHAIVAKSRLPMEVVGNADNLASMLAGADWVVDALFGSGLQGPVRPPFDRVIEAINASGARVFAVDIPSGLDADTGRPVGPTVRADVTATVVAPKRGFAAPEAAAWLGKVHVVGMGAPRALTEL